MKNYIFDAHQDILWYERNRSNEKNPQTSFNSLIQNSVKLVTASIFLDPEESKDLSVEIKAKSVEVQICEYLKIVKENSGLMLIKDSNDLNALMNSNLTGLLIHLEGVDFLTEENIGLIDEFYGLGLRSIGLVWLEDNSLLSSSKNEEGGLTNLGTRVIDKCNQLGIIVDLAHSNERGFYDALGVSVRPISVSHSNCFSLCQKPRNLKDDQILALSEKGGVQGIYFSGGYVKNKNPDIKDVLNHIEHSYQIAPDSTIIGSDFGGITSGIVPGLEGVNKFSSLASMVNDKLGEEARIKIFYKNYLNFLEKIL